MKANIYYTATNVSGFSFKYKEQKFEVRHYDRNGEFLRRTEETPRFDHFTKVGDVEFPLGRVRTQPTNVNTEIPVEHLEAIFHYFNMVMPSEITRMIKEEGLDVEHSSMSIGDMIEIDGHYFIVDSIGFKRITF